MRSLDRLLAKGKRALAYLSIGLVGFMPMKEAMGQDAEWYLNPFNRPRETTIYYGSGYVDGDEDIDSDDVQAIRDGTKNYMADVDGDGDVDEEDALMLEDHVTSGTILPSEWGNRQTKEGRDSWLKKMALIDPTSEIPPVCNDPPLCPDVETRFVCINYATQNCVNRVGYWENDLPEKYDTTMNGEFDISTYFVKVCFNSGGAHGMNATVTGNNFDFESINLEEPQNDSTNVKPEKDSWNIPYDSRIYIYAPIGFTSEHDPDMIIGPRLAMFEVDENGNVSLNEASVHSDLVLTRTPQDTIPPEIVTYDITNPIFSPNGDGIKDTSTIDLKFSEKTNAELTIRDSAGNLINDLYSPYYTVTDPKPKPWDGTYGDSDMVAPDGVYNIRVSLEDLAGNTFTDSTRTITLDTIVPEVSITHPESDSTYTSHVTGLEYLVSDANPDSMWFSSDSGLTKTYIPWNSPITDIKSEQGKNTWILYASDEAGNFSSDTAIFNVDTTTTNIAGDPAIPFEYSLSQNYPNPFNPTTTIEYILSKRGDVSLNIYNLRGEKVEELVDQEQPPGPQKVFVDLSGYSSGIYFYRLVAGDDTKTYIETKKMALIK